MARAKTPASLPADEQATLARCEAICLRMSHTYDEIGAALATIRAAGLYRATHRSFARYCQDRLEMSRTTAYQHLDAHAVVETVRNCGLPPPVNEYQARLLARLPAADQGAVWGNLLAATPLDQLTGQQVAAAVRAARGTPAPTPTPAPSSVFTEPGPALLGVARCWTPLRQPAAGSRTWTLDPTALSALHAASPPAGPAPLLAVSPVHALFGPQVDPGNRDQLLRAMAAAPPWTYLLWADVAQLTMAAQALEALRWPPTIALGVRLRTAADANRWAAGRTSTLTARVRWLWWDPCEALAWPSHPWQRVILGPWHQPAIPASPAAQEARRLGFLCAVGSGCPVHLAQAQLQAYLEGRI